MAAGAAALIALSLAPGDRNKDWRSSVEEYTSLYTNETFSPLHPDAPLEAIELSAVGTRVGVNLTPEGVALPGLRFTGAFMLSYKGSPLTAIAMSMLKARLSCSALSPMKHLPLRCVRSGAASSRSLLGHAEDAAIW